MLLCNMLCLIFDSTKPIRLLALDFYKAPLITGGGTPLSLLYNGHPHTEQGSVLSGIIFLLQSLFLKLLTGLKITASQRSVTGQNAS